MSFFYKNKIILNSILFILSISITMSCMNNNNVTWYEKETIRSIDKIDENTFKIEIGISAQLFYLDKNNNSTNIYEVLNYSLKNKKNIRIGIENNTNKILYAYKLNEK